MTTWVKVIIAIVAVVATVSFIGGGYLYIKGLNDDIKSLQDAKAKFETAVETQKETIKALEAANNKNVENVKLMQNAIGQIQEAYGKTQDEVAALRRKYARPVIVRRGTDGKANTGRAAPIAGGYDDINRLLTEAGRVGNSNSTR